MKGDGMTDQETIDRVVEALLAQDGVAFQNELNVALKAACEGQGYSLAVKEVT
jgi:hypothetical protein